MRRTNGSRNSVQGSSRRTWGGTDQNRMRGPERLQGRHSRDGREGSYRTEEDNSRYAQGHSGGLEDSYWWEHNERSPDSYGGRGMSERSREWQDKDVYSTIEDEDLRTGSEDYPDGTNRYGRGSDLMDEDHRWRMAEAERYGPHSGRHTGRGNESQKQWRAGSRMGRRRRIVYD